MTLTLTLSTKAVRGIHIFEAATTQQLCEDIANSEDLAFCSESYVCTLVVAL
jgi:hypothetical protein